MRKLIPIAMTLLLAPQSWTGSRTYTSTGFFADEGCAKGRANSGAFTQTNPECARKCIEQGSRVVFIDERGKALFFVKGYDAAKEDLGYRVEVTGKLDDDTRMFTVDAVKRIEYVGSSCSRSANQKRQ